MLEGAGWALVAGLYPRGWSLPWAHWVLPPLRQQMYGKPPDTAQAHGIAHARQDKLDPVRQLPCLRL